MVPLKGFTAVSVTRPAPACTRLPVPESNPPKEMASERLNASVPLATTSETTEPEVPPAPTCTTPEATDNVPLKVLAAVSTSVPAPSLVSAPLPETTLAKLTELVPVSTPAVTPLASASKRLLKSVFTPGA